LVSLRKVIAAASRVLRRLSRRQLTLGAMAYIVLLGGLDYLTGPAFPLGHFYSMPIYMLAWFVGSRIALQVAVFDMLVWLFADVAAEWRYAHPGVFLLNGAFRFLFYIFMVAVLSRLRNLQQNLEALAEKRARDLASEAARNTRLEREVMEAGEREYRRIGQDLHDGLCQHLTGTALASQVLTERLPENENVRADARRLVALIEDGITLARGIAKGLYPIEKDSTGLMNALEHFAENTTQMFGVDCRFECPMPVLIENANTASHLYRIAQEAVSNAIRHGRATRVTVLLEKSDEGVRLRVSDNGAGLPKHLPKHGGMGLRTMADRTSSIGGRLSIHPGLMGGAEVVCSAPARWLA
jgi:signal transduction histidine kinase